MFRYTIITYKSSFYCVGKVFFQKYYPCVFAAAMKNAYSSQMIRKAMPCVLDASLGRVMVTVSPLTV